jgi:hypothetical protein
MAMNETSPSDAEALRQRAAALDDFHAMLAAEALGRRLDAAMPEPESVDPSKLPTALREPAERAIAAAQDAMEKGLERGLAVEIARTSLAVAAETPAAVAHLAAALDEAEAPPRTLVVPEPLSIGAAIALVIFVAKLRFEFKVGPVHIIKDEVSDETLGQLLRDVAKSLFRS